MSTVNTEEILKKVRLREHADQVIAMIIEDADEVYADDNDERLKFLNLVYFRMAEHCGLVPHGSEPVKKPKTPPLPKKRRKRVSHEDGTVFVPMIGSVIKETEKAFIIQLHGGETECVPKSQLVVEIEEGEEIDGLWVTEWIADQKNWERD